jgi:hypothetical protein
MMKHWILTGIGLALAAMSWAAAAHEAAPPAANPAPVAASGVPKVSPAGLPRPEDGYFQVPVKVADGVWVLAQPTFQVQPIGNVGVIEQSDGLVLVDAGGSPGATIRRPAPGGGSWSWCGGLAASR